MPGQQTILSLFMISLIVACSNFGHRFAMVDEVNNVNASSSPSLIFNSALNGMSEKNSYAFIIAFEDTTELDSIKNYEVKLSSATSDFSKIYRNNCIEVQKYGKDGKYHLQYRCDMFLIVPKNINQLSVFFNGELIYNGAENNNISRILNLKRF